MASTKRVQGNYNIHADEVRINGDLVVIGTSTSIESTDTDITDNIITLNKGEVGSNVTLGTSGISIDRGSSDSANWLYNDPDQYWSAEINGSLINIRAADPVANSDVVTLGFITGGGVSASGPDRAVQFHDGSVLGGEANFSYYANGNVVVGNLLVANNAIITTLNSSDLVLSADGLNSINTKNVLKMDYIAATPSSVVSTVQILANTPGEGGTGLYFVNTSYTDELISKRKATWIGLVMS